MKLLALLCAIVGLSACGGGSNVGPPTSEGGKTDVRRSHEAAPAVERPRAKLTARQLAGQHVIFPFAGRTPPLALLTRIRRGEAAGVLFLGGNLGTPAQVRALTQRLESVPRPKGLRAPLLLMVDQEGGSVKRLPGAPRRSAPQIAATGDPAVARAEGRATARTLQTPARLAERGFGKTPAIPTTFLNDCIDGPMCFSP